MTDDDDPGVERSQAAGSRFEAVFEEREVPRLKRSIQAAADIAGNLATASQPSDLVFYKGRYRYRILIRDRVSEVVVRGQDWGFDTEGARAAFDAIEHDLAHLSIAAFRDAYDLNPRDE